MALPYHRCMVRLEEGCKTFPWTAAFGLPIPSEDEGIDIKYMHHPIYLILTIKHCPSTHVPYVTSMLNVFL